MFLALGGLGGAFAAGPEGGLFLFVLAYFLNWCELGCYSKTRKACANTMRYD